MRSLLAVDLRSPGAASERITHCQGKEGCPWPRSLKRHVHELRDLTLLDPSHNRAMLSVIHLVLCDQKSPSSFRRPTLTVPEHQLGARPSVQPAAHPKVTDPDTRAVCGEPHGFGNFGASRPSRRPTSRKRTLLTLPNVSNSALL